MKLVRFADTVAENCQPLPPQPTDVAPSLGPLKGIQAVLFDIYGTLLISASGDIGNSQVASKPEALAATARLFSLPLGFPPQVVVDTFEDTIRQSHRISREDGIEHPEVDIVQIWRDTLRASSTLEVKLETADLERFAFEYEVRVNPVWPMPGVGATLESLHNTGMVLGIVSNAQFFTPFLFPALLGKTLGDFGFDASLSYLSFAHGCAKPGIKLFELAKQRLQEQYGIGCSEVLYVGNDMLNDITASAQVGFRTALFAGDQRSLRWRSDDERVVGVQPDLILTELTQLQACLTPR